MQKRSSYYAQHSATPAFLIVSEGLVQVLWKREGILNSSLWFKMSSKSKIISERHISHIKHKHMQRVYLLIICSAFLWAAHLKAKHADELGTSPFPRKTILGARQWFLINALTAKMMGKGSAAFCKGKYSDSCVRRNTLTKDWLCTSQVTTLNVPHREQLMTIGYSWRHRVWGLVQLGTSMSVLMKWKHESVIQKLCWKHNLR